MKTGQFELGYRFRTNNGFKGQISGFISNSDKNIALKRDGLNLWVEVVDQKLRNMGVETEVSYTNGGFYVGANTLLIKSEVEKNGDWQKQDVSTSDLLNLQLTQVMDLIIGILDFKLYKVSNTQMVWKM